MAEAGPSTLSMAQLDAYWERLLERFTGHTKREVLHFQHCSWKRIADSIRKHERLLSMSTDFPAQTPLASSRDVEGVWLQICSKYPPSKSPFGTYRIRMGAMDILTYLGSEEARGNNPFARKRGPHRKQPLLFFESSYYFNVAQYVRLLLVRPGDVLEKWCRETCLEVDISNNPFLELKAGRLFTYKPDGVGKIIVNVLVVGDICLNELREPPVWDKVKALPGTGREPVYGVRDHRLKP